MNEIGNIIKANIEKAQNAYDITLPPELSGVLVKELETHTNEAIKRAIVEYHKWQFSNLAPTVIDEVDYISWSEAVEGLEKYLSQLKETSLKGYELVHTCKPDKNGYAICCCCTYKPVKETSPEEGK